MEMVIRPLEPRDFRHGLLETLGSLAPVDLTPEEAEEVLRRRSAAGVHSVVAVVGGRVIGTASLILEHKFIHRGGTIGHIEDVAVHPAHGGKGHGDALVAEALALAAAAGCDVVGLDASVDDWPRRWYGRRGSAPTRVTGPSYPRSRRDTATWTPA